MNDLRDSPFVSRARRRGILLIAVMICLLVVMGVSAGTVRMMMLQHRQSRVLQRQFQAEWLASAGVDRAAARLGADSAYPGEVWRVAETQLGGDTGAVTIEVAPNAKDQQHQIIVRAAYPEDASRRVVVERQASIPFAMTGETP